MTSRVRRRVIIFKAEDDFESGDVYSKSPVMSSGA